MFYFSESIILQANDRCSSNDAFATTQWNQRYFLLLNRSGRNSNNLKVNFMIDFDRS